MQVPASNNKRVVVVYWKNKAENPFEVFSSLKNFCVSYKEYNYNTLSNYLSKRKIAYDNDLVRVERKNVILKPQKRDAIASGVRSIIPVVRKVLLKDANDTLHDMHYWMSKTAVERVRAVTSLITPSLNKNNRIDKTMIIKRKLHV